MKTKFNAKGVTLIELLVALVISGLIVAAIYRLFVAQARSYTVQDQVAEVQQNVRNAMELIVRDIRMAGFDNDTTDTISPPGAVISPLANNSLTVSYEHYDAAGNPLIRQVTYSVDPNNRLMRNQTEGAVAVVEPILDNVAQFDLTYFIDMNVFGKRDRRAHFEVQAGAVPPEANVVAVRVRLSAQPASNNPDVNGQVSPRRLDTVVTMRNELRDK